MPATRTPAQVEAARRNGARSRGPATPEGKARSALNATRHGLAALAYPVLRGEDADAFAALHARLLDRFAPGDEVAGFLVWRLASAMWRLQRAERLEVEAIDTREQRPDSAFLDGYNPHSPAVWDTGRVNTAVRYGGQLERAFLRLLREVEERCPGAPGDDEASQPNEPETGPGEEPTGPADADATGGPVPREETVPRNEPETASPAGDGLGWTDAGLAAACAGALAILRARRGLPDPNEPGADSADEADAPSSGPDAAPPRPPQNRLQRRRHAALERRSAAEAPVSRL